MKKKNEIILCFIILLMMIGLFAVLVYFSKNKEPNEIFRLYRETGIAMSIKENTLGNTGATLILTNQTDIDLTYGDSYIIDYNHKEKWFEFKPIIQDYEFDTSLSVLKANQTKEIEVDWEWLYGKLSKGKYRIIINESNPIEFEIK